MNPDTTSKPAPVPIDTAALLQLSRVLVPLVVITALTDFLFWQAFPGLNVGVFLAGIGVILLSLSRQRPSRMTWLLAAMLGATCVQSAIDLSMSTVLAGIALVLALAGDVFQPQLRSFWARFSEAIFGFVRPIHRWVGLKDVGARAVASARLPERDFTAPAAFAVKVILPAAVLVAIFGGIFAAGNAAFSDLVLRAGTGVWVLWLHLDITPLRIIWWAFSATVALGLIHGTRAPDAPRWWTLELPRVPRREVQLALWQTGVALFAMNVLFFLVNTLDAVFLWGHFALPAGVSASEFLHDGVNKLIAAVVLSALVIAGMFQQQESVSDNRWLKRLAHLWVLQNLLLIGGVLRRVLLYAEEYGLTEKRVYVCCFLLLVTAGFLLLAWFVQKRKSFNWLLGQNAIATFGLFFLLQCIDVRRAVASYNVERWEKGRGIVDLEYLAKLGPSAWPELIRVARGTTNPAVRQEAKGLLSDLYNAPRHEDWRSYQYREAQGLAALTQFQSESRAQK